MEENMAVQNPGEAKQSSRQDKDYFVRFSVSQRIQHIILITTFVALAVTGLAQKFYTAGWANWVILSLGGIELTRLIHRIFAVIFMAGLAYHFVIAIYELFVKHAKVTMLFTRKDVTDVVREIRYSFGLVDKPPEFGRFDYKQKFEYWGIVLGSFIIIISGLILMFPVFVTQVFPGDLVPAAKEFHGNEATLAVIVIVIWHLYDVILRPGIFPADTSIFTGKISKKRMLEEHGLEYAEIEASTEEEPVIANLNPLPEQTAKQSDTNR